MTGTAPRPADTPPLVIAGRTGNSLIVAALDEAAEMLGLRTGTGLADARAMHPQLRVEEADPDADRRLLEAVAAWCDRYTPLVAIDTSAPADDGAWKDHGLFLDITGCAHLFGGEAALVADITARLHEQGLAVQAGLASAAGTAWATARYSPGTIVPPGAEQAFIAPLPVAAMRLPPAISAGLGRLGLHVAGTILDAPRAPLVRRFGRMLADRIDLAVGRADEIISPLLPVPERSAERRLSDPVTTTGEIEHLALCLAERLKPGMEERGEGARRLSLALFRVDGAVMRINAGSARPVREPHHVMALLRERLKATENRLDAGFGFDLVRLSVMESAAMEAAQGDFHAGTNSGMAGEDAVALLAGRFTARLGPQAVGTVELAESHLPERMARFVACGDSVTHGQNCALPAPDRDLPLRLHVRPEPVEAVAEIPEGPPVRFRWRRALHTVVRAEGPERIEAEWWHDGRDAPVRDYYRIEDDSGRRYWIFREGLWRNGGPAPRWFMHGAFA